MRPIVVSATLDQLLAQAHAGTSSRSLLAGSVRRTCRAYFWVDSRFVVAISVLCVGTIPVRVPQVSDCSFLVWCLFRYSTKGNISRKGTRICHLPGRASYAKARIDTAKGERWFCSEAEARAAAWCWRLRKTADKWRTVESASGDHRYR